MSCAEWLQSFPSVFYASQSNFFLYNTRMKTHFPSFENRGNGLIGANSSFASPLGYQNGKILVF
jgi:hypothetical protein